MRPRSRQQQKEQHLKYSDIIYVSSFNVLDYNVLRACRGNIGGNNLQSPKYLMHWTARDIKFSTYTVRDFCAFFRITGRPMTLLQMVPSQGQSIKSVHSKSSKSDETVISLFTQGFYKLTKSMPGRMSTSYRQALLPGTVRAASQFIDYFNLLYRRGQGTNKHLQLLEIAVRAALHQQISFGSCRLVTSLNYS